MWTSDQWCRSNDVILSIFACIINEPLTKSDMVTNDMDVDMDGQGQENRPNRGWYIPLLGRAGNLVVDLTGMGRGLRPSSPRVGGVPRFSPIWEGKRSEISCLLTLDLLPLLWQGEEQVQ